MLVLGERQRPVGGPSDPAKRVVLQHERHIEVRAVQTVRRGTRRHDLGVRPEEVIHLVRLLVDAGVPVELHASPVRSGGSQGER